MMIDGQYYVAPHQNGATAVGAVVAMGDTQDEAIAECKRLAEMVEGYSIEKPTQALDKAGEQLSEAIGARGKPASKTERKAASLAARGAISPKQLAKMGAED